MIERLNNNSSNQNASMHAKSVQSCLTLCDAMEAHQPPLSMEFSKQEYWSGLPCPPPEDLPYPCLMFPTLAGRFFTNSANWEAYQKKAK